MVDHRQFYERLWVKEIGIEDAAKLLQLDIDD
jgi:hypothetical protein